MTKSSFNYFLNFLLVTTLFLITIQGAVADDYLVDGKTLIVIEQKPLGYTDPYAIVLGQTTFSPSGAMHFVLGIDVPCDKDPQSAFVFIERKSDGTLIYSKSLSSSFGIIPETSGSGSKCYTAYLTIDTVAPAENGMYTIGYELRDYATVIATERKDFEVKTFGSTFGNPAECLSDYCTDFVKIFENDNSVTYSRSCTSYKQQLLTNICKETVSSEVKVVCKSGFEKVSGTNNCVASIPSSVSSTNFFGGMSGVTLLLVVIGILLLFYGLRGKR